MCCVIDVYFAVNFILISSCLVLLGFPALECMIKTFAIMKKENVFTLVSVVLQQQLETATFEITGATQSHVPERVG